MKKTIVRFAAMILPFVFSAVACGPGPTSSPGYDGRVFDISEKQDKSLTATSEKVGNNYSLTISGSGKSVDYTKATEVPWNPLVKKIETVTINEGITHIGDYMFNNLPLNYFILPSTVSSIGENSFHDDSTIYSYGPKIEGTSHKIYYYSETRPTEEGDYFYMKDGVPNLWEITSVLFIGNSFTYFEGSADDPRVPDYFQRIASNLNYDTKIDWVIKGSHKLSGFKNPEDEMGKIVEQKLTTNRYDYVILQEHSTTPISNYDSFVSSVKTLKARIDETQEDCETILYQTRGSPAGIEGKYKTVGEMEQLLRDAYRNAGTEAGCKVHYVGKAFRTVYEEYPTINIYYTDNRHQNNLGAYLSAAVHVKSLFGADVTKCTQYCDLDEATCKTLLSVANSN